MCKVKFGDYHDISCLALQSMTLVTVTLQNDGCSRTSEQRNGIRTLGGKTYTFHRNYFVNSFFVSIYFFLAVNIPFGMGQTREDGDTKTLMIYVCMMTVTL